MSKNEKKNDKTNSNSDNALPIGGLLDGVASIIGRLGELAEKGEALRREGHFESKGEKDIRGSYGFSVKLARDAKTENAAQPITPHRKARPSAKSEAQREEQSSVRTPRIDIFEETDHLLIIAEMPGVPADQVTMRFDERKLFLAGQASRLSFETEIDLPFACSPDGVSVTANNGVIEIRISL